MHTVPTRSDWPWNKFHWVFFFYAQYDLCVWLQWLQRFGWSWLDLCIPCVMWIGLLTPIGILNSNIVADTKFIMNQRWLKSVLHFLHHVSEWMLWDQYWKQNICMLGSWYVVELCAKVLLTQTSEVQSLLESIDLLICCCTRPDSQREVS